MGDAIHVCPREPRKMKFHQIIAVGVVLGAAAVSQAVSQDPGGPPNALYSAPGSRGTTSNNHGNSNFNRFTTNQHHGNINFRQTSNQHHGNTNFRQTSNSFGGQQQASAGFGGHSGTSGFRATAVAIPVGVVADILSTLPQHTNSGNQGNFQGSQGGFRGNHGSYQGSHGGFRGNQESFQGNQGGFQRNQEGFQGNQGGFSGNQAGFNQGFSHNNNFGASNNQFRGQQQYSGNFRGSIGFGGQGSSQFQGNAYQQPSQNFASANFRGNNGW